MRLMERPTWKDDFVKRRAIELCMPRIRQWMGDDPDERSAADDLKKVLGPYRDGYEMAHDLERKMGWASNSALVEVLEECTGDCRDAIKELTSQWVRCYRITPEFAVGDVVALKHAHDGHKTGIVVKVVEDEARYGVRVEGQPDTSCFVENYEDVSAVVALAVAS